MKLRRARRRDERMDERRDEEKAVKKIKREKFVIVCFLSRQDYAAIIYKFWRNCRE